MPSILSEPISEEAVAPEACVENNPAPSRGGAPVAERVNPEIPTETREEFEIVLGRRQIASVLFVATVILVVFSASFYLAGKSNSSGKEVPDLASGSAPAVAMPASQASLPAPLIDATIAAPVPAPWATPATGPAKSLAANTPANSLEISMESAMFAEPVSGEMYLQMAAVGKGAASIFAEGLRNHGFPSFVAPGPSETMFRVLIGPLPDTAAYTRTKDALDQIGVATFGRKYSK